MEQTQKFILGPRSEDGRYQQATLITYKSGNKKKERILWYPATDEFKAEDRRMLNSLRQCGIRPHHASHGGIPRKSIKTCTAGFSRYKEILEVDIKDFYPSCTKDLVLKVMKKREFPSDLYNWVCDNGFAYYNNEFRLPTGAAISTFLADICISQVDAVICSYISNFVKKKSITCLFGHNIKFLYRRYVDNIIIGFSHVFLAEALVSKIYRIIRWFGFEANTKKTRILGDNAQRRLLGVSITTKQTIDRRKVDLLRAKLHQFALGYRDLWNQNNGRIPELWEKEKNKLLGQASFFCFINKDLAGRFRKSFKILKELKTKDGKPERTGPNRSI